MADKKTMMGWAILVGVALLLSSCSSSDAFWQTPPPIRPTGQDIMDTAIATGDFETFVGAMKMTGLSATLRTEGPFTVFAPTDEAFAKLPAGNMQTLLKPENRYLLRQILSYHVVSGTWYAADLMKMPRLTTINGRPLYFDVIEEQGAGIVITDPVLKVKNARIIRADIQSGNGIIHVIDAVMSPTYF